MPRPREFQETAALEVATECFWRRGYEATSLRDLTASMGLTAPSPYNAFGGKQELFSRALERYLDRTTRDRLRRLEQSLAPKAALQRFFAEIIEHSISDRQREARPRRRRRDKRRTGRMTLRLYDLAGADPDRRFNPYCWRIRHTQTRRLYSAVPIKLWCDRLLDRFDGLPHKALAYND